MNNTNTANRLGNTLDYFSQNMGNYRDMDGISISSLGSVQNYSNSNYNYDASAWNDNLRVIDDDEEELNAYEQNRPIHPESQIINESESSSLFENFKFDVGTMSGAFALNAVNSAFTTAQNTNLEYNAKIGNSPSGHAPDTMLQMQHQQNINNVLSDVRTAELAVGSMFGPEGLLVGAGAALLTQNFSSGEPVADMQTNAGDEQAASTIAT